MLEPTKTRSIYLHGEILTDFRSFYIEENNIVKNSFRVLLFFFGLLISSLLYLFPVNAQANNSFAVKFGNVYPVCWETSALQRTYQGNVFLKGTEIDCEQSDNLAGYRTIDFEKLDNAQRSAVNLSIIPIKNIESLR